jgi:multidrug resistance efflux pump
VTPRTGKGGTFRYLLEDPQSKEIFEFGAGEYFLCRLFDGETPLHEIQSAFQKHFGTTLEAKQLGAFARRLSGLGLLGSQPKGTDSNESMGTPRFKKICDPDRLFGNLSDLLTWCFTPYFLVSTLLVLLLGIAVAMTSGGAFLNEYSLLRGFLGPGIFYLTLPLLGFLLLNPLAEISKGISCRYYGGHVPEFGVGYLFRIIPHFYSDISDAYWFMEKPTRVRILSSGLVLQLLLWAISIIAWKNTAPWDNANVFWFFLTLATTLFFLVNIIPFFQRDGYLLLVELLDIRNLNERAEALVRSWIFRKPQPEALTSRESRILKWYGSLAFCFKLLFWGLLLGFAGFYLMDSLHGLGALLFLAILYLRFEGTIKRSWIRTPFLGGMLVRNATGAIKLRLVIKLGLLALLLVVMFIPYPFEVGGDFTLLPSDQLGIRAEVPGHIQTVQVKEGEWVLKGQPVAVLEGRDQSRRLEQVKAAIDETQAKLDLLKKGAKKEEIAKAEQAVKTAAKSLEYSSAEARRYKEMYRQKAVTQTEYENILEKRDLDRERLKLAQKNLELVQSGAREEEIRGVEAELRLLEVELSHAQRDLDLITLTSPMEGRIITPRISDKVGQYLSAGDLFAVVEDARTCIAEIEVSEKDIGEVNLDAKVKLKFWAYPDKKFIGHVTAIAPVAYEKSWQRVERTLSDKELLIGQKEVLRDEGKVIRVLAEFPNEENVLRTDMTGYAKIAASTRAVALAFTRWLFRFFQVEVWSWIP